MRIKKAWIDYAEEQGACKQAISWLRKKPRTMKQLAEYKVGGYWRGYSWLKFALAFNKLPREARKPAREALKAAREMYSAREIY